MSTNTTSCPSDPDNGAGERKFGLIDAQLLVVAMYAKRSGESAPAPVGPEYGRDVRFKACVEFLVWCRRRDPEYFTQALLAQMLNDLGQTTRYGRPWIQASVSHALRKYGSER